MSKLETTTFDGTIPGTRQDWDNFGFSYSPQFTAHGELMNQLKTMQAQLDRMLAILEGRNLEDKQSKS